LFFRINSIFDIKEQMSIPKNYMCYHFETIVVVVLATSWQGEATTPQIEKTNKPTIQRQRSIET